MFPPSNFSDRSTKLHVYSREKKPYPLAVGSVASKSKQRDSNEGDSHGEFSGNLFWGNNIIPRADSCNKTLLNKADFLIIFSNLPDLPQSSSHSFYLHPIISSLPLPHTLLAYILKHAPAALFV